MILLSGLPFDVIDLSTMSFMSTAAVPALKTSTYSPTSFVAAGLGITSVITRCGSATSALNLGPPPGVVILGPVVLLSAQAMRSAHRLRPMRTVNNRDMNLLAGGNAAGRGTDFREPIRYAGARCLCQRCIDGNDV